MPKKRKSGSLAVTLNDHLVKILYLNPNPSGKVVPE